MALPEMSAKVAGGFEGLYSDSKRFCDDFVMIVLQELAGDHF